MLAMHSTSGQQPSRNSPSLTHRNEDESPEQGPRISLMKQPIQGVVERQENGKGDCAMLNHTEALARTCLNDLVNVDILLVYCCVGCFERGDLKFRAMRLTSSWAMRLWRRSAKER